MTAENSLFIFQYLFVMVLVGIRGQNMKINGIPNYIIKHENKIFHYSISNIFHKGIKNVQLAQPVQLSKLGCLGAFS